MFMRLGFGHSLVCALVLSFIPLSLACGADSEPEHAQSQPASVTQQAPELRSTPESVTPVLPAAKPKSGKRTHEYTSRNFHINRKWKSMEGPSEMRPLRLIQTARPEVVWLTGYRAEVVGKDSSDGVTQEFMCHNNLELDFTRLNQHQNIFGWDQGRLNGTSIRLFTLSQGQFEVNMPKGFGVPVRSDEKLFLTTQVLNHNVENPDVRVRHDIEIDYIADTDLEEPLKPLYQSSVFVLASLEDTEAYFGVVDPNVTHEGSSCSVGILPPGSVAEEAPIYKDEFGQKFAGHWVVPPGREVRHTLVTRQLNLTNDTTIHFIGTHVHPFSVSLELRDLTTNESLFTVYPETPENRIGLVAVATYSSAEGIPLFMDHDYELVSVYENTSGVDQDAMATFFLYLYDHDAESAIDYMRKIKTWTADAG